MSKGRYCAIIALLVAFSFFPAQTFADWTHLGQLKNLTSNIYLNADRYSYRIKQNLYSSGGSYFSSSEYYQMFKVRSYVVNNSQEYSYNIVYSFKVDIGDLGSLIAEMANDPYGFKDWVLTTAKNYPIDCKINIHTGWIYENYTWKNRPVENDLVCSNVAKGTEPAMARAVPLKGDRLYLQKSN